MTEASGVSVADLVMISVDDHVLEPADVFTGRVSRRHADAAPRVVTDDDGRQRWTYQGRLLGFVGDNAAIGKPRAQLAVDPGTFTEMRAAAYDVHERVRDMDANGVQSAMCFPTFPRFAGQVFAEAADKDVSLASVRAYNDWHVDAWCGAYPDRFIPLGLVPLWDAELAAAEVRRLAAKGCHAVTFSENPAALGLPSLQSDEWDPFFAACVDHAVVPCVHLGSSSKVPQSSDAPVCANLTFTQMTSMMAATVWSHSPVFHKFPDLRVSLSEGGIGWVPYLYDRWSHIRNWHGPWAGVDLSSPGPVELFHEHFYLCFIDDPLGIELRERIGVHRIMWECDYPHPDSTWPESPEWLAKNLEGCTPSEVEAITHANAA
ncbi:MAG TPA: amidohydrolase family protein, partial [Acidimicrobiales bacterium]|nr:amidohydrolase family protein [Acidimicrobiales bacterium]